MNLHELVSQLIIDTKGASGRLFDAPTADSSLGAFMPELVICAAMLAMLALRLPRWGRLVDTFWIALAGSIAALYFAAPWQYLAAVLPQEALTPLATDADVVGRMEIFTGMLVHDPFSIFVRSLLVGFLVLMVIFTRLSGIPDHEDAPDVYTLVFGATLGMCLMASANHLLTVFLAVEMASVPSYVLAGILKGRRQASEASLKYVVYGAGAAGVMLYGISLVAGLLNSAHLPTIAMQLADRLADPSAVPAGEWMVLALGALFISVGLAFKLSAVPFHFWCPDVFEGATAEVNAFLSIASKAAALALLVRVALGMTTIPPEGYSPGQRSMAMVESGPLAPRAEESPLALADSEATVRHDGPPEDFRSRSERTTEESERTTFVAAQAEVELHAEEEDLAAPATAMDRLRPVRSATAKLIAFFAIVTCTFGNLAAYGQNNLKRLFAYSTIAHAGYMMMPVAAAVAMAGISNAGAERAIAALAIYMVVYLFMNLSAFAVVAFLRNAMRTEELPDFAGLVRRSPLIVVCMGVTLFGLIGLPPLSGFIGKFAVFATLVEGWQVVEGAGQPGFYLLLLLLIGGLNTAISLFYYLRVAKVMTIDEEPLDRPPGTFSDVSLGGAFVWLVTLPTAFLIVSWNWLSEMSLAAARHLLS